MSNTCSFANLLCGTGTLPTEGQRGQVRRIRVLTNSLRLTALLAALTMALVMLTALIWAPEAPTSPKPIPTDRTAEVQILGLNETHGQLVPLSQRNPDGTTTAVGGAAALATYLGREEAENPLRTLIVDSGDFMQGPAISSYFEGKSTVEVFNEIGVDTVAVG